MCSDLLNGFEGILLLRTRCRCAAGIDTEFIILNEIFLSPLHLLATSSTFSLLSLSGERLCARKKGHMTLMVPCTHLLTAKCHHFPLNLVMTLFISFLFFFFYQAACTQTSQYGTSPCIYPPTAGRLSTTCTEAVSKLV